MRILVANHSTHPHPGSAATALAEQRARGVDLPVLPPPAATPLWWMGEGIRGMGDAGTSASLPNGEAWPRPVVTGELRGRPARVVQLAAHRLPGPWKLALPGPCTLAWIARRETERYREPRLLAAAFRDILLDVLDAIAAAGASMLQLEEPLLPAHPEDLPFVRRLLEPLLEAARPLRIAVAVSGDAVAPVYAQLESLPVDVLALDVSGDEELIGTITATGSSQTLALGLVDPMRGPLPDADWLAARTRRILHRYVLDEVLLQPARGLAPLDPAAARVCLELLVAVRDRLAAQNG